MIKDKPATININREFYNRIKRLIEQEEQGYDSPSDFIKSAIREKLEKYGIKLYEEKKKIKK